VKLEPLTAEIMGWDVADLNRLRGLVSEEQYETVMEFRRECRLGGGSPAHGALTRLGHLFGVTGTQISQRLYHAVRVHRGDPGVRVVRVRRQ
jgi:hypothetical protein